MTGMRDSRTYGIGRFWYAEMLSEDLVELAQASARAARTWLKKRSRVRRWQTLRPGADTPLWNALAGAVEAQLKRRGAKSRLARLLGISRQRLHKLIVVKSAYPDAERALLLQVWLQARLLNRELIVPQAAGRKSAMSSIK